MGPAIQGYLVGLAYVAPIGMQNAFIIRSAAGSSGGRRLLAIALWASLLDISLALACFFGIGLLLERMETLRLAVMGLGALAVIAIGGNLIFTQVKTVEAGAPALSAKRLFLTLVAVTWLNPQAILDGTLLLGGFRAALLPGEAFHFIGGVMLASLSWFFGLTFGVHRMRRFMTVRTLRLLNAVCGGMLLFFGGKLGLAFFSMIR